MTTLSPDERAALVAAAAVADAWRQGTSAYWLRRAEQLEAARPRPGDFNGQATPAELTERWQRLTDAAQACRNRATGLDGWCDQTLAETADSLRNDQDAA